MKTIIASYGVNKFIPYVIFSITFLGLFLYLTILGKNTIDSEWAYFFLAGASFLMLINISWLLFGKINLISDHKQFIIEKELFTIKYFRKKIKKPFDVELVQDLKSNFSLGNSRSDWFAFYHKKGLCFFQKNGDKIYEIGLNDTIDADLIFRKID